MRGWNKSQKLDRPMKIQAYSHAVIDRVVRAKLFLPPHFTLKSVPGWALNSMGTLVIGSWSPGRYARTKSRLCERLWLEEVRFLILRQDQKIFSLHLWGLQLRQESGSSNLEIQETSASRLPWYWVPSSDEERLPQVRRGQKAEPKCGIVQGPGTRWGPAQFSLNYF